MTLKELIIGHYEGSLNAAQQTSLDGMLASSPEARSLFEQYGAMEEAMEEESRKLVPPVALREATLAGALGVAAETISGGVAAWFTTKVAAIVGTAVVAGTVVGIVALNNDEPTGQTTPEVPVVEQTLEAETQQEPPAVETTVQEPVGTSQSAAAGTVTTRPSSGTNSDAGQVQSSTSPNVAQTGKRDDTVESPQMTLGGNGETPAEIKQAPTVSPSGDR